MSDPIIRVIENDPLGGRVADALQPVIRKMLQSLGTDAKDALHGKWLGHPLHAALVALPIGAWTLAFLCDVAEIARGKRSRPAEMAISVGLAGAVASAVTGLADWSEIDGRAKKIGLMHGTMNLVATALYLSSLATRRRSRSTGMAMSMVAFGVANAAAYLGGHLVFSERIGVKHTGAPTDDQPESFVAVLDESALVENQLVRATAGEVPILLVRTSGQILALGAICTHLGGPLAEGTLEGMSVRCPWHGSRFCLENGSVLESPATFPERTFDVRVRDGKVEVRASRA